MAISLFVTGDVVPKGIQPEEFKKKSERIFGEMNPYIMGSDFCIANLEAPIVKDKATTIKKSGPCLGVSFSTIEVLKQVGFGVLTLANNHFFDQGQKGVENTINTCNESCVATVGGGKNITDARKPLLLEKDGKRVAIINACEQEFSIANSEHGGSNPLDLINMHEDIVAMRHEADYVVMILHGGLELYHFPTPRMKRMFRHFVDLGVDAVINHHQHCINGYEVYRNKPIFYGLGNFYFPFGGQSRPASWNFGFAVRLILGEEIGFEMIPYKQTDNAIILRETTEFESEMELLNFPIKDDFLLQQKFDGYLIDHENRIQSSLLPSFMHRFKFDTMVRRGWLGRIYREKDVYVLKNMFTCESKEESIRRLLEIMVKK